jgi:hypothetical protein
MRPIHFEILTDDPQKAVEFYQRVFDWDIATWDGPQTYWMATTGDDSEPGIDGGFMGREFDQAVINTIAVDSLDVKIEAVKDAGGALLHGPNEIPNVGLHVYCTDNQGIIFGMLESLASED